MRVLIRCDGNSSLGVGHVVRSLAVASEAQRRGHQVELVGSFGGSFLTDLIENSGVGARRVPEGALTDARSLAIAADGANVLHVDHYGVDAGLLAALRNRGRAGGAVLSNASDGRHGARPADIAVDQTPGAELLKPNAPASWHLRGARHALVRQTVTLLRNAPQKRTADLSRVLVVMGGTDPSGVAPMVVEALAAVGMPLDVVVIATVGTRTTLESMVGAFPGVLRVLPAVPNLPELMAESDLVVSAAGTSVWELCALQVPMALVSVVDNQRAGYDAVVGVNAGLGLGDVDDVRNTSQTAERLRPLLGEAEARREMAERAGGIVDGLGAWRLVTSWESVLAGASPRGQGGDELRVRPVTMEDSGRLLEWRNDERTREVSRDPELVAQHDHVRWLERSLTRTDRVLLIAEVEAGRPVGTIRWDRIEPGRWEVSITVAPEARGRRLAAPVLGAGERYLGEVAVDTLTGWVATVHQDNAASMRLFASSGYLPDLPPDAAGFARFHKTAIV